MDIIFRILLTFIIGFIASFIGSIAGGGGLISIPFLIFMGLPPQIAIATNKFGAVGLSIGATIKFIKKKKIIWKYVIPMSILSIAGGIIGAKLLIDMNEDALSRVVGILILILLPLIFVKKDIGKVRRNTSNTKKAIGFILYFLIMIFGGFFGGGSGVLIFYCLMFFMGFTIIEANATDIIPWLLLSIASLIMFMIAGIVDYILGISLFLGMIAGGYTGAHTAIKKGDAWVKIVFAAVVIISGIKILYF